MTINFIIIFHSLFSRIFDEFDEAFPQGSIYTFLAIVVGLLSGLAATTITAAYNGESLAEFWNRTLFNDDTNILEKEHSEVMSISENNNNADEENLYAPTINNNYDNIEEDEDQQQMADDSDSSDSDNEIADSSLAGANVATQVRQTVVPNNPGYFARMLTTFGFLGRTAQIQQGNTQAIPLRALNQR